MKYHLIHLDGRKRTVEADEMRFDSDGDRFEFRRDGELAGQIRGSFLAWCEDPPKEVQRVYHMEIEGYDQWAVIRIAADSWPEESGPHNWRVFEREGRQVGVLFVEPHSWWIEQGQ